MSQRRRHSKRYFMITWRNDHIRRTNSFWYWKKTRIISSTTYWPAKQQTEPHTRRQPRASRVAVFIVQPYVIVRLAFVDNRRRHAPPVSGPLGRRQSPGCRFPTPGACRHWRRARALIRRQCLVRRTIVELSSRNICFALSPAPPPVSRPGYTGSSRLRPGAHGYYCPLLFLPRSTR